MSLWDRIVVTSPDGGTEYGEGVDYVVDYDNDTISRIAGGGIPDGGPVKVQYSKGVAGDILERLKAEGEAVLRPVVAMVKILPSAGADLFEEGIDLSDEAVRIELTQTLEGRPDELEVLLARPELYPWILGDDDIIIAAAFGEIDSGGELHFTECFRGLVVEKDFVGSPIGTHHFRILARDFSISLDAPRQGVMGRTWHPTLRREVFRNGTLVCDDFRRLKSSQFCDSTDFDDIVEIHFAKEHPRAHQIIRDCFEAAASPFLDRLIIDCLDFPVPFMDGLEKTPGEIIREIAQLAGASVHAEGTSLHISERGFPADFQTCWVYDTAAILDEDERLVDGAPFTAVQIFGRSETSRLPTKSACIPPTDFTQPGWCRVVDEKGTLEPAEPIRSDELPQPAELTFQLDGALYHPASIRVVGGKLAKTPAVEMVQGKPVINVTVLIDWKVEDKAGDCPYFEDEAGNRWFRIKGRVYDAVPTADGEYLPIPYASVRRERLDGDNPGETFDISADSDGFYLFGLVPIGTYRIIASSPGYLDNFSDDDPGNDEIRDLYEELASYEEEIEKGRYEKQATDYHVIVWARPRVTMGPLADLTVSQVLLEVRLESTKSGTPLVYGPAVRDERITTEVLARRIGEVILAEGRQSAPSVTLRLPMNRWLKAGDGIRVTGRISALPWPAGSSFQAAVVRKVFCPAKGIAHDIVSSSTGKVSRALSRGLGEDPLDTRVGVVIAVYRNELGGQVYDVAAAGRVLYGLKAWPALGELRVGETVQVSRSTSGGLSYLVVARTSEVFGEGRICYV